MTAPRVEVLRPGTYRDMHGTPVVVDAGLMAELAASYDPALYAAPLVVGHPRHNSPRFGTLAEPRATGDALDVALTQLDPAIVAAHRAGHYPQRSLSWWPAGHPDNPLPDKGRAYIRHLGLLGGVPPAVKGLRAADLAESAAGVVEIALADADTDGTAARPAHTEEQTMPETDAAATEAAKQAQQQRAAELAEQQTALDARAAELDARAAAVAAAEAKLAADAAAAHRAEVTAFAEQLATDAKLRPADVPRIVDIILALGEARPQPAVEFAEAAEGEPQTPAQWLRARLAERSPLVELGEVATKDRVAGKAAAGKSDAQVAREARAYRDAMSQKGITISLAEAVDAVEAGTAEA